MTLVLAVAVPVAVHAVRREGTPAGTRRARVRGGKGPGAMSDLRGLDPGADERDREAEEGGSLTRERPWARDSSATRELLELVGSPQRRGFDHQQPARDSGREEFRSGGRWQHPEGDGWAGGIRFCIGG